MCVKWKSFCTAKAKRVIGEKECLDWEMESPSLSLTIISLMSNWVSSCKSSTLCFIG